MDKQAFIRWLTKPIHSFDISNRKVVIDEIFELFVDFLYQEKTIDTYQTLEDLRFSFYTFIQIFLPFLRLAHSLRKASTGFIRAARRAGKIVITNDKKTDIPIALATSTPRSSAGK